MDGRLLQMTKLLVDPVITAGAKSIISEQIESLAAERAPLKASLDALRDQANDNTDSLADFVRETLRDARERIETVSRPGDLNEIIGELLGPSVVSSDGRLTPKMEQATREGWLAFQGQ